MLPHGLNQIDCANNVVCVVQHGKLHTLSNSFASSKVDDSIKPAKLLSRLCTLYLPKDMVHHTDQVKTHSLFSSE